MLSSIHYEDILFLDIETVSQEKSFDELSETMQYLWDSKSKHFRSEEQTPEDVYNKAGIYAEFGKIVCISVGLIVTRDKEKVLREKSYYGDDEKKLLLEFSEMLKHYYSKNHKLLLCAHNGKEFDFPYIARRMLILGLKLPTVLDIAGKKPWEVKHLDTMELWKFGDYKHYTSLRLLTEIFNIPSPKDDIDGSQVGEVYWQERDLARIAKYCQKDVLAVAQLWLRYRGESLVKPENIELVD